MTILTLHFIWKYREIGGLTQQILKAELKAGIQTIRRKYPSVVDLITIATNEM
jgi:hypothetical protein